MAYVALCGRCHVLTIARSVRAAARHDSQRLAQVPSKHQGGQGGGIFFLLFNESCFLPS